MMPLVSEADAIGILLLIVIWTCMVVLFGVWIGAMISRRNSRR